ncbi:hypothetical protein L289_2350 [Acinetobacter gerneri DSM 14967 = CIP 107464 = MTCC 9824]|nr:hypothetical protein L289_2350 [Acinetobacter gerneri DSM 14967 = CIP 107464 = MTCC 9824]
MKLPAIFAIQNKLGTVLKDMPTPKAYYIGKKDKLLRLIVLLHINQFV